MKTTITADFKSPGNNSHSFVTPVKLSKEELTALSTISPLASIYNVALEWGLITAAAMVCQRFWNPWLYVVTVAFIGARQHALLILMHEGTHYRLFRHRGLNDWVAESVLAWPFLATMGAYRANHLKHHSFVNSEQDPDWMRKRDNPEWQFPAPFSRLLRIFIRDLSGLGGINLIRLASSFPAPQSARSKAFVRLRIVYYVTACGVIVASGGEKAVFAYWIVPFFTALVFIMRVRSIAEHFAIEHRSDVFALTRTMRLGFWGRLLLAPKNVNYHIEHHFFPSVPFFRLPQLHALLMSKQEFASEAHITNSYLGLIRECVGRTIVQVDCKYRFAAIAQR
jgi:fatty acid desaturase